MYLNTNALTNALLFGLLWLLTNDNVVEALVAA